MICKICKTPQTEFVFTKKKGILSRCKLCERKRVAAWRSAHPEKMKEQNKRNQSKNGVRLRKERREKFPEKCRVQDYRNRAKRIGVSCLLSSEAMTEMFHGSCFYCGLGPSPLNGIDRIDSDLGYEPGNVVSCCLMCNKAKLNHTRYDFENWLERAYLHIKSRRSTTYV